MGDFSWSGLAQGALQTGANALTGGLVSAGLNMFGGLFGESSADKYKQQQNLMRLQADLNERAMGMQTDQQKDLMSYSSNLQRAMNGESTMVQRRGMAEAGINPNFAQGAGPVTTAGPSGSASALGVGLGSAPPYRYSVAEALQASMLGDQMANLKSDTELKQAEKQKRQAETDRQLIENVYLPAIMQGQIDLNGSVIDLNGSQKKLNESMQQKVAQETLNLQKQIDVMNQQIAESQAKAALLTQQQKTEQIVTAFKSKEMQAIINNYASQTHKNYTEARDIIATQVARINGLDAEAFLKRQLGVKTGAEYRNVLREGVLLDIKQGEAKLDLQFKEEFGEVDHFINSAGNLIGDIGDALNVVDKFTPKKSKKKR